MSWVTRFVGSTIGKKVLMAVSGVALVGFVVGHMVGNLLLYQGPEAINAYAEGLRKLPALLWGARVGLLAAVGIHIWSSTALTLSNQAARPVAYRQHSHQASTYASRTMKWSGPLLLLFIIYHLLHFTTGAAHPEFEAGNVYRNVVIGFQNPAVAGFYIAAMLALGVHLSHGVWSMLQTVGLSHPRYDHLRTKLAVALTVVVVLGNISFPVSVLTGVVR